MTSATLPETIERNLFGSYLEPITITPFDMHGVIKQLPWRPKELRNAGIKFAHPKSNVSVLFEPACTYSYVEDVDDSQGAYLGTTNEQLVIASQRWVFYMNGANGADLERKFVNLKEQWYNDTSFDSSISLMQEHPAYLEILSMGAVAIPFILRELEKGLGYWFPALKSITGHDPVDRKDRGRVKIMAQLWLQWGKGQGYKW